MYLRHAISGKCAKRRKEGDREMRIAESPLSYSDDYAYSDSDFLFRVIFQAKTTQQGGKEKKKNKIKNNPSSMIMLVCVRCAVPYRMHGVATVRRRMSFG
jgi:hypothetical protein